MNLSRLFVLLLSTAALLSCEKKEPVTNNNLVGKWKLVELLMDPGDGSGAFQKVTAAQSGTLEFKPDGSFKEIKGPIYSSLNPCNYYELPASNRIELSMREKSSWPKTTWYIHELTPHTLIIHFGCTEPCLAKYVAIK